MSVQTEQCKHSLYIQIAHFYIEKKLNTQEKKHYNPSLQKQILASTIKPHTKHPTSVQDQPLLYIVLETKPPIFALLTSDRRPIFVRVCQHSASLAQCKQPQVIMQTTVSGQMAVGMLAAYQTDWYKAPWPCNSDSGGKHISCCFRESGYKSTLFKQFYFESKAWFKCTEKRHM